MSGKGSKRRPSTPEGEKSWNDYWARQERQVKQLIKDHQDELNESEGQSRPSETTDTLDSTSSKTV